MTNQQIHLVKRSWFILQQINHDIVADAFYTKLFTENPSLRKMFPEKMEEQYEKLIDMISVIIVRLDRIYEVNEEIEKMAERHVEYGVKDSHYKLVGDALLWTLSKALGNEWTLDMSEAWTACYITLKDIMLKTYKQN